MRAVVDGAVKPEEGVRAYHADLQKAGLRAKRPLDEDCMITESVLK